MRLADCFRERTGLKEHPGCILILRGNTQDAKRRFLKLGRDDVEPSTALWDSRRRQERLSALQHCG